MVMFYKFIQMIFTESVARLIQSISCDVSESVDWRLLFKERIANIGIHVEVLGLCHLDDIGCFEFFWGLGVFANQPTVHNGTVSRGRVRGCGC